MVFKINWLDFFSNFIVIKLTIKIKINYIILNVVTQTFTFDKITNFLFYCMKMKS